jgi:triosephosphate isomerase
MAAAPPRHGAIPLVCVGETHEERRAGRALDVVLRQVDAALAGRADWGSCAGRQAPPPETPLLVAYEPVWAIGEAGREPRAEELVEVTSRLAATPGVDAVLYGGSVHPRNARELLDVDGVDGLFVGRGAWDVRDFLEIVRLAAVREGHVTDAATPFTQPIAH